MPEPLKLTGSLVLFETHLQRWHRLSSGVSQMICQSKITWLLTDCPLVSITVLILHCVYVWMCESAWIDSVINDLHFNTPINHSVWSHVWNCKSHPLFFQACLSVGELERGFPCGPLFITIVYYLTIIICG